MASLDWVELTADQPQISLTKELIATNTIKPFNNTNLLEIDGDLKVNGKILSSCTPLQANIISPCAGSSTITIQTTSLADEENTAALLTIDGELAVNSGATISGATTITGAASITGAVSIGGATSIGGAASIGGALSAGGAGSFGGGLSAGGALNAGGAGSFGGSITSKGSGNFSGDGNFTGSVNASKNLTVAGSSTFTGIAAFTQSVNVGQNLTVLGNTTVSGSLTVAGLSTFGTSAIANLETQSISAINTNLPITIKSETNISSLNTDIISPYINNTVTVDGNLNVTGSSTICNLLAQNIIPCNPLGSVTVTIPNPSSSFVVSGSAVMYDLTTDTITPGSSANDTVTVDGALSVTDGLFGDLAGNVMTQNISPILAANPIVVSASTGGFIVTGATTIDGVLSASNSTINTLTVDTLFPYNTISETITVEGSLIACDLTTTDIYPCDNGTTVTINGTVSSTDGTFIAGDENTNLILLPNGTGALQANTNSGEGQNAVDLQIGSSSEYVAAGEYSVIAGGNSNSINATASYSVICGGQANTASGVNSFIGGGGGYDSAISQPLGNVASGGSSFIGGGQLNTASGTLSVVVGGGGYSYENSVFANLGNTASGDYSSIGGGQANTISASNGGSVYNSSIGGGEGNVILSNEGTGDYLVIAGGEFNTISSNTGFTDESFIGGGESNTISASSGAECYSCVIAGGSTNTISASNGSASDYSVIPGGFNGKIFHSGCFVFNADSFSGVSTGNNDQVIFNLESGVNFTPGNTVGGVPTTNEASAFYIVGDLWVTGTIHGTVVASTLPAVAPRADLTYRGKIRLEKGLATINIDEHYKLAPGTFAKITKDPQVFITNNYSKDRVYIKDIETLPTGIFEIISEGLSSSTFVDWMVVAEPSA